MFGGFNELPMDSYHMEALFKSLLKQFSKLKDLAIDENIVYTAPEFDAGDSLAAIKKNALKEKQARSEAEKFFYLFLMPMVLLTLRLMIDVVM